MKKVEFIQLLKDLKIKETDKVNEVFEVESVENGKGFKVLDWHHIQLHRDHFSYINHSSCCDIAYADIKRVVIHQSGTLSLRSDRKKLIGMFRLHTHRTIPGISNMVANSVEIDWVRTRNKK